MNDLKPCPMCGSPMEIDSTGVIEAYGHDWQEITIECTDVKGSHCGMTLTLHADMWHFKGAWNKLVDFWNEQL